MPEKGGEKNFRRVSFVTIPIGNPGDISQRALATLKEAQVLWCENGKTGREFLKGQSIPFCSEFEKKGGGKTEGCLLSFVEFKKNSRQIKMEILELLQEIPGPIAIFSDCGSPLIEDPGLELKKIFSSQNGFFSEVIPGVDSLGVFRGLFPEDLQTFHYLGFPPRNLEERANYFIPLKKSTSPIVFLETPYRVPFLMMDLATHFEGWKLLLGLDLTTDKETLQIFHLTPCLFPEPPMKFKGEAVLALVPPLQPMSKNPPRPKVRRSGHSNTPEKKRRFSPGISGRQNRR